MLVITGNISVDPSKRDEITTAAIEMMKATRAEPGCIDYALTWDLVEEGVIRVIEQWEDQAALDAHFAFIASQMDIFARTMGVTKMELKKFEISSISPIR